MAYPNLRAEMARLGISVAEVANATDKKPRTITNWLSGTTEPDLSQINAIRDKLFPDYPIDYLFNSEAIKPY